MRYFVYVHFIRYKGIRVAASLKKGIKLDDETFIFDSEYYDRSEYEFIPIKYGSPEEIINVQKVMDDLFINYYFYRYGFSGNCHRYFMINSDIDIFCNEDNFALVPRNILKGPRIIVFCNKKVIQSCIINKYIDY